MREKFPPFRQKIEQVSPANEAEAMAWQALADVHAGGNLQDMVRLAMLTFAHKNVVVVGSLKEALAAAEKIKDQSS